MANRYWVGGTANWDGTAGTKWAATSNGPGGETVPTTADDVFFDAFSTGTVTISTGNTGAKSINCTGFTGTLANNAAITVAGSYTLVAGMTYTHTSGTVTFTGTGTLTTAGKTFSGVTVNGAGITVTLGDALNLGSRNLTITQGTFDTSASNYSVTAFTLASNNSNTRTINLNASTVSVNGSGGGNAVNFQTSTNLTFNAGTSQINCISDAPFYGGGKTFYNVSFTSTARDNELDASNSGAQILDGNTFNNLSVTAPATNFYRNLSFGANQTINGTLTVDGASPVRRINLYSVPIGTSRTLTVNSLSATDCNFRDITIAGTAAGSSPTRAGDMGNNSGINFPAPKTVYWNLAGTQDWTATAWAPGSGGTPDINNYPLPQDTAVIDNTGAAGTINFGQYQIAATINASSRTSAATLDFTLFPPIVFGSIRLGSGITPSGLGSNPLQMAGRGANTILSAGKTLAGTINIQAVTGSVTLEDALSATQITVSTGTFNAGGYNVTVNIVASSNSNTRTITMGSGTWTLSGTGTVWNLATTTNLTFNKDTANILLSNTSTTARTFAGGGQTYNKLTIGGATGTSTLTMTGANTFSELASTKTVAHTIIFPNSTTTVAAWTISGSSGNLVTLSRTGASGTFTLAKSGGGTVSADYLSISNSTATPSSTWYAGTNSTDGGGNTGWLFTAAPSAATGNFFMLFQ